MKLDHIIAKRTNKTVYRDGDRVLKVFEPNYSKADILNEALNQARVEETGLNMPRVLEVTTLEDGRWVIVFDYIEGKTLAQLMEENPAKSPLNTRLIIEKTVAIIKENDAGKLLFDFELEIFIMCVIL